MNNKTPDYTRRAINAYKKTVKVFQISVKLDIWERMQAVGMTAKSIKPLIMAELERRERSADDQAATGEDWPGWID